MHSSLSKPGNCTDSVTRLLTVWSDTGVFYSKSSRSRNKLLASNRGEGEVCEEDKMCVKSLLSDFTHILSSLHTTVTPVSQHNRRSYSSIYVQLFVRCINVLLPVRYNHAM